MIEAVRRFVDDIVVLEDAEIVAIAARIRRMSLAEEADELREDLAEGLRAAPGPVSCRCQSARRIRVDTGRVPSLQGSSR